VSCKYEFIDAEYAVLPENGAAYAPTIMQMCGWLGVSKSGYYEWRSRPESATARRRELLKIKINALFEANDETYGYRRLHAALVRGGEQASDELVRQLMREIGLVPCQPKPWRRSLTAQDAAAGPVPDLVNRDFTAEKPGEKMVGDITYILIITRHPSSARRSRWQPGTWTCRKEQYSTATAEVIIPLPSSPAS
jgi:putative transposase